jgi:hypothetical protein
MKEFVVKKSFHGSIREKRIIPELEKWVTTVSKAVNSGSLIFNRYLLHCTVRRMLRGKAAQQLHVSLRDTWS